MTHLIILVLGTLCGVLLHDSWDYSEREEFMLWLAATAFLAATLTVVEVFR